MIRDRTESGSVDGAQEAAQAWNELEMTRKQLARKQLE